MAHVVFVNVIIVVFLAVLNTLTGSRGNHQTPGQTPRGLNTTFDNEVFPKRAVLKIVFKNQHRHVMFINHKDSEEAIFLSMS
jgi:hypothetical protein